MEVGEGPSNLDEVLAMFGQIEKKYLGGSSQTQSAAPETERRIESSKSEKSLDKRAAKGNSPTPSTRTQLRISPEPSKAIAKSLKPQEGSLNNKVQEIFLKYTSQNENRTRIRKGYDLGLEASKLNNSKNKPVNGQSYTSKFPSYQKSGSTIGTVPGNSVVSSSLASIKSPSKLATGLNSHFKETNPSPRLSNKSEQPGPTPPSRKETGAAASQGTIELSSVSVKLEDKLFPDLDLADLPSKSLSPHRRNTTSKSGSLVLPGAVDSAKSREKFANPEKSADDVQPVRPDISKIGTRQILESGAKFIKSFTKGHADINKNSLFGTPLFSKGPGSDKSIKKFKDTSKSKFVSSNGSHEDSCSIKEQSVEVNPGEELRYSGVKKETPASLISPPKNKPPIKVYFKEQNSSKQVQLRKSDTTATTPKSMMEAIFAKVNQGKKKSKQNSFDFHGQSAETKDFHSAQGEIKDEKASESECKESVNSLPLPSQIGQPTIGEKLSGVKLFEQHLRNAVAATNGSNNGGSPTVQIINSNIYFPVIKGESIPEKPHDIVMQSKSASPNKSNDLLRNVTKTHQVSHSIVLQAANKPRRKVGETGKSYLGSSAERGTLGSRILNKDSENSVNTKGNIQRFAAKRKSDQWSDLSHSHLKTEKTFESVRPTSSRQSLDKRFTSQVQKSASSSAQNSTSRLANRPKFYVGPLISSTIEDHGAFSNTILLYKSHNKSYSPNKYSERRTAHLRERSSVDHSHQKKQSGLNVSESDSVLKAVGVKKPNQSHRPKADGKNNKQKSPSNSSGTITPLGFDDGTLSEFTMLEELVNRGGENHHEFDSPNSSVLLNSSFVSPILANTTKIYKRDESPTERSSKSTSNILDLNLAKKDLRDFKILDNVKEHDEFREEKAGAVTAANNMKKKQQPAQVASISQRGETQSVPANPVKKLVPISGNSSPVHHSKHKYYMEELLYAIKHPGDKQSQPFMNHLKHMVQSLLYIRTAIKPHEDDLLAKSVYLPPNAKKGNQRTYSGTKTIIFDLDETLIHCIDETDPKPTPENPRPPCDAIVPVKYNQHETVAATVYIRPGAKEALLKLKQHFEIVVFTASHACYANKMIDLLDPKSEIISFRLFRESCHKTSEGVFVKDLRIIANRHLKDIVLIDNAAYSFGFQQSNGIPVLPFYTDKSDTQLASLTDFLLSIKDVYDVRPVLEQTFKMELISKYSNKLELITQMLPKAFQTY